MLVHISYYLERRVLNFAPACALCDCIFLHIYNKEVILLIKTIQNKTKLLHARKTSFSSLSPTTSTTPARTIVNYAKYY